MDSEVLRVIATELEKEGYTIKRASKSRRVQIVMTESLYNAARQRIEETIDPVTGKPLSFNQYVSNLVLADVKDE